MWKYGNVSWMISYQLWKCGNVEIWKCVLNNKLPTVEVWICGNVEIWKCVLNS